MAKTVIKEIIIMLLLVLAIILALGILFYDYIPASKIVPTIEAYQTPNTVTEALANDILADTTEVIITREIDKTDLSVYEQAKDYKKGKANPFEDITKKDTTNNNANSQEQAGAGQTTGQADNTNNSENVEETNKNDNSNNNIDDSDNDFLSNTVKNKGTK